MLRLVVTFISGLFLAQVSIAQDGAHSSSDSGKNVATIAAYDADGRLQTIGTGFIVEGGSIITSAHVVRGAHYISSTFSDALDGEIKGVGSSDRELDLAVLTASSSVRSTGLTVSQDRPAIGAQLTVIGSPMGLKNNVTTGVVKGFRSEGDVELLELTAEVSEGSAGSPVLNARGEIVGIVSAQFGGGEGLSIAVSAAHLADVIGSSSALGESRSALRETRSALSKTGAAEQTSSGPSYSIVVSSETAESSAQEVAQSYRNKGYEAQVFSFKVGETMRYRVCLGTYATIADAKSDRDRLADADLPDDAWVVQVP